VIRNLQTFLAGGYANRANTHRKFGTTSPQFSRKADPNVFVEDRQSVKARTVADRFAFSVISTRRHLVALVEAIFTAGGTRADLYRVEMYAKWNRKFPEFPNFRKKGQSREVNQNFRNEFPETFCSIRFTEILVEWNVPFMKRICKKFYFLWWVWTNLKTGIATQYHPLCTNKKKNILDN